jgi:hypothetical protein
MEKGRCERTLCMVLAFRRNVVDACRARSILAFSTQGNKLIPAARRKSKDAPSVCYARLVGKRRTLVSKPCAFPSIDLTRRLDLRCSL